MPVAPSARAAAVAAAAALAALLACAGPRRAEQRNLCAEARDLPCALDRDCALDEARGCFVCACRGPEDPPTSPAATNARPDVPGYPPPPTSR